MQLNGAEVLLYTSLFLVPGAIATWTRAAILPRRATDGQQEFLRFLAYGGANYLLWSPIIRDLLTIDAAQSYATRVVVVFGWGVVLLVGPVGLGLAIGLGLRWAYANGPLELRPFLTAWEDRFFRLAQSKRAAWVLVTLKDSSAFGGYYGRDSCVSTDPAIRDVYIELVYSVASDGAWTPRPASSQGMLIRDADILHVEFFEFDTPDIEEADNAG